MWLDSIDLDYSPWGDAAAGAFDSKSAFYTELNVCRYSYWNPIDSSPVHLFALYILHQYHEVGQLLVHSGRSCYYDTWQAPLLQDQHQYQDLTGLQYMLQSSGRYRKPEIPLFRVLRTACHCCLTLCTTSLKALILPVLDVSIAWALSCLDLSRRCHLRQYTAITAHLR